MNIIKHQEEFTVRSYEIGQNGKATLPSVANYFQEAAGKNARDLNFDIEDLQKKGATWVLYRMHIRMNRFPERWQPVIINTWPSSGDGIRAFRDYELVDKSGETLGVAVSQWMVLNMEKRRPMRIPSEILEMGLEVDEHKLSVDKRTFPEMEKPDSETLLTVGLYDLDMNHHVNNVKYIEWMSGYMDRNQSIFLECTELNLQYHKEAGLNQKILIQNKKLSENRSLHNIRDAKTDELLAEGISEWAV